MIHDKLETLPTYSCIPQVDQISSFIQSNNLNELPLGKTLLDGENLYLIIEEYNPRKKEDAFYEIHFHTCDIQIILNSSERMGVCSMDDLGSEIEKQPHGDVKLFHYDSTFESSIVVRAGEFVFFPPLTPHMPSLAVNESSRNIRKAVFKVKKPSI